jgi:STE24 endopeptidase
MIWLTAVFIAAVVLGTALQLWLSARQATTVARHREHVPEPFADQIALADHQKAADYTIAKVRFNRLDVVFSAIVTLALTVGGGIAAIDALWRHTGWSQPWLGTAVILSVLLLTAVLNLPFNLWSTFRLEARFGFNRMTPRLFVADLLKGALLSLLIGGPLIVIVLSLMERAGTLWWIWAWAVWLALMLLMTWAWPAFIAPLFNKFSALEDPALKRRIESLLGRCGFTSKGVFVVDGSRRSAHGNAYFTGIGRHKRIVFFDTLLDRLGHAEVEAVLAHELGHFSLKHVRKRLIFSVVASFFGLALLGWLTHTPAFYAALGVPIPSTHAALLLFLTAAPVFGFFATPLGSLWSRRHEFEADGFAARHASATELATALVKLYRDNANTLTPDPIYSAFHYSHPPALMRIARLRQAAAWRAAAAGGVAGSGM